MAPADELDRERHAWSARADRYATYAVPKNTPYAADLVQLSGVESGSRVLDVAAGPGVVAIAAGKITGVTGTVLATDLVPAWAPFVDRAAAESGIPAIPFAAMPGDDLALDDAAFDIVLCQFGLMFMPDPLACLREMRRVLVPGGTLGVAVWSTPDKVAHFTAMRALRQIIGEPPASPDAPKSSPLSMGKPGLIEGLVAEAAFTDLAVHRVTHTFRLDDPREEWARMIEEEAFATAVAAMSPEEREDAERNVIASMEQYRVGDHLMLPSEAIMVIAHRPGN